MAQMFRGTFSSENTQRLKVVYSELAATLHASEQFVPDTYSTPVPGSANHKARAAQLWDAYEQSGLLIYSAEDHLRTILRVFEGTDLPTYSLFTLLRGAAVPIVTGAYLLEPGIDDKTRLARALNVRWVNVEEQNKLDPNAQNFAKNIAHLEERAAANGITVFKKDPARPATDFGERRLSEFALCGRYLKGKDPESERFGGMVYRYLSGHVHAMLWVKMINADVAETSEPGISSLRLDLQFDWFATMLQVVLRLHVRNITSLMSLSGFPRTIWEEAMKTATSTAQARYVALAERQAAETKIR